MAEKTHDPTPQRLRDARKKGEVVFSGDVTTTAVFVAVVVALWLLGATVFSLLHELWRHATSTTLMRAPDQGIAALLTHAAQALLWGVLPITAVALLSAVAGSFFQVGGLAVWSRLNPDMNRLNPAEGLKRLFSSRNLVNLLKMVIKTLLLAALLFIVVRGFLDTALKIGHSRPSAVMMVGARAILITFGWACIIYAVMAAVDYTHQRYEFMKQHRMSIDDVRRENKDTEGDPLTSGRRRAAHFEAVFMSLGDRVRAASAVIHSQRVAVALQYLGEKDLPRVVARGEGQAALQIVRFATEALIPIEEDAGLAERIYEEVPADQPIHRSLYGSVAKLMRWAKGIE